MISSYNASVEGCWNVLEGALVEATDRMSEWTKGPVGHKETSWWNDNAINSVSEKEKYLEGKKKARRTVYQTKCKIERKRLMYIYVNMCLYTYICVYDLCVYM